VKKAVFSISCTTCRTRLVVRSEAAIGQILECPKCQSMVLVTPPPGWTPSAPPLEPSLQANAPANANHGTAQGPPPLDRVTANPETLALEPTGASLLRTMFSRSLILWGAASAATLAIVCGLCWLALRSNPSSTPPESEQLAASTTATTPATVAGPSTSDVLKPAVAAPPQSATKAPPKSPPNKSPEPASKSPPLSPRDVKPATLPTTDKDKEAAKVAAKDDKKKVAKESDREPKETEVAEKPELAEVKKSPPAAVDVAARLADPLRGIDLNDIPLARALETLEAISTVPITLDPDALRHLGATPRDHVTLKLDSATVEQVLRAVAAQRGLTVAIDNDQVIVTTPTDVRETLKKIRYTVSDLTGDDNKAAAEFALLVKSLVAPESWQAAGGRGTITPDKGAIVVSQTGNVHRRILVFCEKLRNARHKPLRSRDAPEQFALTTRTAQARKMLDKPVTVNFHEPTPLAKILAFLAQATGSDVLIDHAALAAIETSDRVETSLTVQEKPLEATLADLLRPLGLTSRVVSPSTIQVTAKEDAEERLELEFYPVGPQAKAADLIARIKTEVTPTSWTDAGGAGEVVFDPPSQCLIVLQSQPTQVAVERFLATKAQ
jgi:hypothetical protein